MPRDNFCPVCAAQSLAGSRFCGNCGHVFQKGGNGGTGTGLAEQPVRRGANTISVVIILVSLLLLAGGGGFWYFKNHKGDVIEESNTRPWLRLRGSTTIGLSLAPKLAEGFFRSKGATDVTTTPTPGKPYFLVHGTLPTESSSRVIEIDAKGSGAGFVDLSHNAADVAMSSREIKPKEQADLASFGDFSEQSSDRTLGLDGVAVIVNNQNPLQEIALDDLARIYAGDIRRWENLKNAGTGNILVLSRDDKSGTWETFRDLVLEPVHERLIEGPPENRFADNSALAAAVAANPMAIGFVGMTYTKDAKILRVGYRGLQFLLPTRLTVLHEEYPLRRRLHLFVPSRGTADPSTLVTAREFCQFSLSPAGQSIVDSSGFVSEDTESALEGSKNVPLPKGYPNVMRGAEPLYTLFFRPGKADLDSLALDNIDRLTQLMTSAGYRSATVFLAGHADNTGGHQLNLAVSEQRVTSVRETLRTRGVPVDLAIPLGETFPIEPNVPGKGNPRNRRVEVWIRKN